MGAVRLLDRIESTVQEVLASRVPDDDTFEYLVSVVPTIEGCDEHGEKVEMALAFYATLGCPEASRRIVANVLIPLRELDQVTLEERVNDIWDRMVLGRMSSDFEDEPDES